VAAAEAVTRPRLGPGVPAAAAVGSIAASAWVLLATGATGHMSHDALLSPGRVPGMAPLLAFLGTWQVMVAAMMLPPAIPAVAALARRTEGWQASIRAVVAATCAVCAVWTGFAVAVLAGDLLVHRLVAAWPWLAEREWLISAAVLVLAGAIELAPFQRHALAAARGGSVRPWPNAVSCLRTCWPLMLVMFAIGLESLLWMAVLAAAMTVQRLAAFGPRAAPAVGLCLISLGLFAPFGG
jgi:predicted metal-binding membrane protein